MNYSKRKFKNNPAIVMFIIYLLNCFKKILIFKLRFPSSKVIWKITLLGILCYRKTWTTSVLSFRILLSKVSELPESRFPNFGELWAEDGGTCWQNKPSISDQSISAIGECWWLNATCVHILFLPTTYK